MTETAEKIYQDFKSNSPFSHIGDEKLKEVAIHFDGKCVTCFGFRDGRCANVKSKLYKNKDKFKSCELYMYLD